MPAALPQALTLHGRQDVSHLCLHCGLVRAGQGAVRVACQQAVKVAHRGGDGGARAGEGAARARLQRSDEWLEQRHVDLRGAVGRGQVT
jgi:hypothetical protein